MKMGNLPKIIYLMVSFYIDNPNEKFIKDRGLFYEASNFKEFTLSGLNGSEQPKQIAFNVSIPEDGILGNDLTFQIQLDGNDKDPIVFANSDENGDVIPFDQSRREELFDFLEEQLGAIAHPESSDELSGDETVIPAFKITKDSTTGDFIITGKPGVGEFDLIFENPSLTLNEERSFDYSADTYQIEIAGKQLDIAYRGTPEETAQAIVNAVNQDEDLNSLVEAKISDSEVLLRAIDSGFDFEVKAETTNSHDAPILLTPEPSFELTSSSEVIESEDLGTQTIQVDSISTILGVSKVSRCRSI